MQLPFSLDVGATHIRAIMIPELSDVRFSRIETPGPDGVREGLRTLLRAVGADGHALDAVGLSRAAALDSSGRITSWPSRQDWLSTNLLALIRDETRCGAIFDLDDGMAAGFWEYAAGGFPLDCTVGTLSIGTGLGVGIVQAGALRSTGDGETTLGHTPIGLRDRLCSCGRRGCLQATLADPSLQGDLFARYLARARDWLVGRFQLSRLVVAGGAARFRVKECLAVENVWISAVPDASAALGAALFAQYGGALPELSRVRSRAARLAPDIEKHMRLTSE